jgi:hypothetical protein
VCESKGKLKRIVSSKSVCVCVCARARVCVCVGGWGIWVDLTSEVRRVVVASFQIMADTPWMWPTLDGVTFSTLFRGR